MNLDEKRARRRKIVVGSMIAGNVYMTATMASVLATGELAVGWIGPVIAAWNAVFWAGATYLVHRRMKRSEPTPLAR